MRKTRTALFGVLLLALSACSSGGTASDNAAAKGPESTSTPSSESSASATGAAGSDVGVQIATSSLGDVLVDAAGMTLYMYDPDQRGASTCYDKCATAWPPLVVDGEPKVGTGADDSKIGTVARTDGTTQVTYGGWPVYYFAKDAAAGDTAGQGVGGVWWVLNADGEPIRGQ